MIEPVRPSQCSECDETMSVPITLADSQLLRAGVLTQARRLFYEAGNHVMLGVTDRALQVLEQAEALLQETTDENRGLERAAILMEKHLGYTIGDERYPGCLADEIRSLKTV